MVYFKAIGLGQFVLIDAENQQLRLAAEIKKDDAGAKLQELFGFLLHAIHRKES